MEYLNDEYLIASKKQDTDLYLEMGEYTFPFEFNLPDKLPTSFEHDIGHIRYTLKGVIDTPHTFKKLALKSFTLLNEKINLKEFQVSLSKPCEVRDSVGVVFFGGKINAELSINKSGYVPGEKIIFKAKIQNKTLKKIIKCSVKLVQRIKFSGSRKDLMVKFKKVKHVLLDLVNITDDRIVPEKSDFMFEAKSFEIPKVCPSTNGLCELIEIEYFVVFEFRVDGSVEKLLEIPIKIVTLPLDADKKSYNRLSSFEEFCLENTLPFSYHEQLDGEVYDSDEKTFKQFYPYFNKID